MDSVEQQEREAHRQRSLLVGLADKLIHELRRRTESTQTRLSTVLSWHRALMRHADLLAHRAASCRNSTLSRREQNFLDELRGIEERTRRLRVRIASVGMLT